MQRGSPWNPGSGLDALGNTGYSPDNDRLNCAGLPAIQSGGLNNQNMSWLNTAAFGDEVAYPGSCQSEGSCGQNVLFTLRWWNFDASILKDIHITESQRLQLRFEGFNPLNHDSTTTPQPTFGLVRGTATGQGIIQVAMKNIW